MKGRNYTVHIALAASLVMFAALAGQVSRWESKRAKFVLREVPPRAKTVEPPRVLETFRGDADVLVRFRAGVSEERKQAIAARLNDRVEDEIESVEGLTSIDDLDGERVEEIVNDYASLPEVEYAEPNFEIKVDPLAADSIRSRFVSSDTWNGPNDPLLSEQWGLINTGQREGKSGADVSAGYAWERTHGSRKVVVAVLDSGVDYTHEDLSSNIWHRPADMEMYFDKELGFVDDYNGFSAVDRLRDPMDENGHGTHCAGIVGAEGDNAKGVAGVNWQVEIMPLKFMGRGGFGTTKDAVEAINYVIERKAAGVNVRVISASWGSRQKSKALEDVIRKAGEADILFVAAAGNDGMDADKTPHYPSNYKLPNVIAVAALDRKDQLAGFSNYGATSVHIAAPGREILSTWLDGAYEEHSGTSMATPFVAGVAGLVLSVEPNLSVKELRERLLGTVDKTDALKGKVSTGGRLNAARAVGATQIK
ncbi:MAG TPA: S8 family serine peptidase [Pyrinomonadaceae bacterium]|jgi:subtilisin family serine protease|nr:S8 family serine peptidase [Pyrinomonadaceae bacterium]